MRLTMHNIARIAPRAAPTPLRGEPIPPRLARIPLSVALTSRRARLILHSVAADQSKPGVDSKQPAHMCGLFYIRSENPCEVPVFQPAGHRSKAKVSLT